MKKLINKKKLGKGIFVTAICTGIVAIIMLSSFTVSLIKKIYDVDKEIDEIISTIVLTNDNAPHGLIERYNFYREFNNPKQWDFAKYVEPILQKARETVDEGCENYHVIISTPINFIDNDLTMQCRSEVDVDGNIAHGFIEIEFYDWELKYGSKDDENGKSYYNKEVEFYRIFENNKVKTYMSLDGESWIVKEGMVVNQNNVLFDVKALMYSINSQDASWFPNYYNNERGEFIAFGIKKTPYNGIMTNSDVFYHECDLFNKVEITLHKKDYKPCMFASSGISVNEDKMMSYFDQTNDSVLNKICESEITLWLVYRFDQYGEVKIEKPKNLSNAKSVNSFYELFVDLYDAIDKNAVKSNWR